MPRAEKPVALEVGEQSGRPPDVARDLYQADNDLTFIPISNALLREIDGVEQTATFTITRQPNGLAEFTIIEA